MLELTRKDAIFARHFHTHAASDSTTLNEEFSDGYIDSTTGRPCGDKLLAEMLDKPCYLGTPAQKIKKYTPVKGKPNQGITTQIGTIKECRCKDVKERGKKITPIPEDYVIPNKAAPVTPAPTPIVPATPAPITPAAPK